MERQLRDRRGNISELKEAPSGAIELDGMDYCRLNEADLIKEMTVLWRPLTHTDKASAFQKVGECLHRYLPSGVYYARIKASGKEIRRSLRTTDRKLADRELRRLNPCVLNLRWIKSVDNMNFPASVKHCFS